MGKRKQSTPSARKSPSATKSIAELRREMDAIDVDLLKSINRRAALAQQVGKLKEANGQGIVDIHRETEVLERAVTANEGPLDSGAVRSVFRELVSGTRAVQGSTRVAYLGPEFTFSHLAAIERFGQSAELVPVATIAAVFEEVEGGHAQFGVVPMENSTDGRVSDTLDCFSRCQAQICGELPLRIHHCLLGVGKREEVRTVFSKPQPLSQCRNWLARHMPQAELREVASTAEAAQQAKGDVGAAAVASAQAGVNYGLGLLARNIEDNADNVTRFAVIGAATGKRTGNDKTALVLEIAHQPGALADAMAIIKRNRLNMTWIESYPIPGARGRYLFFVELVAHQDEPRARRAIAALRKKAIRLDVLGSYAQAEPVG